MNKKKFEDFMIDTPALLYHIGSFKKMKFEDVVEIIGSITSQMVSETIKEKANKHHFEEDDKFEITAKELSDLVATLCAFTCSMVGTYIDAKEYESVLDVSKKEDDKDESEGALS